MQNPRFLKRILGLEEFEQLKERGLQAQSVAGNFCAKEALSKALGTGIKGFTFTDAQVLRDRQGKPYFVLSDLAAQKAEGYSIEVSITHTKEYASAVVLISDH